MYMKMMGVSQIKSLRVTNVMVDTEFVWGLILTNGTSRLDSKQEYTMYSIWTIFDETQMSFTCTEYY